MKLKWCFFDRLSIVYLRIITLILPVSTFLEDDETFSLILLPDLSFEVSCFITRIVSSVILVYGSVDNEVFELKKIFKELLIMKERIICNKITVSHGVNFM